MIKELSAPLIGPKIHQRFCILTQLQVFFLQTHNIFGWNEISKCAWSSKDLGTLEKFLKKNYAEIFKKIWQQ